MCGQPITFRSVGKSGRFCTKWYRVYLIQRRRKTSGFVLRIFHARTWYKKGGYTDCETTCHEEQRRISSANGKEISNFVYGLFKQRKCDGFHMGNLGIILAAVFSIKGWSILTPCQICPGMN